MLSLVISLEVTVVTSNWVQESEGQHHWGQMQRRTLPNTLSWTTRKRSCSEVALRVGCAKTCLQLEVCPLCGPIVLVRHVLVVPRQWRQIRMSLAHLRSWNPDPLGKFQNVSMRTSRVAKSYKRLVRAPRTAPAACTTDLLKMTTMWCKISSETI